MFSQLRHHLSLLKSEEGLPLKRYEHVSQFQHKTPSIKCKATIFNAACVDAVFDVDIDCRIKDLKEMYSLEASNPYSDMLYALDPEKDERPKAIGDGFVPAAVLTLVDEEGRQFWDEELLFSDFKEGSVDPACFPEFTAQVFIATFEVDMPRLFEYVGGESDSEVADRCIAIIQAAMFQDNWAMKISSGLHYLSLRDGAGDREIRHAVEKMLFHISTTAFKYLISKFCLPDHNLTTQGTAARLDFLVRTLVAGVNRFDINDMETFFDEYFDHVRWIYWLKDATVSLLEPIMRALLRSKRVSEEEIMNRVFKKHHFKFERGASHAREEHSIFNDNLAKEYQEVMKGRIKGED